MEQQRPYMDRRLRKKPVMMTLEQSSRDVYKEVDWEEAKRWVQTEGDTHMIALIDYRLAGKHIGRGQLVKTDRSVSMEIIAAKKGIPNEYHRHLLEKKLY